MDLAMVIITGVGALAAVASAIVAIVQASRAKSERVDAELARNDARKARDATLSAQREIADAHGVVADAARRSAPPEWSSLEQTTNQGVALRNLTGSAAVIQSIEFAEPNAGRLHFNHGKLPARVDHGDAFEFMFIPVRSDAEVIVLWNPEGDSGTQQLRRRRISS